MSVMGLTAKDLIGEIPDYRWDRVKNSRHVGEPYKGYRIEGEMTIVKVFGARGKRGACLGYMAVDDTGVWYKWFSYGFPIGWLAGVRVCLVGPEGDGIELIRHDTNPETGLKSNVLKDDVQVDWITVIHG